MRATKCHGDGGLKRLGVSCVRGERHPEGGLSDGWGLSSFRLMLRKMEEGETWICRVGERARTLSVIYNGSKPLKNKIQRGYSDATHAGAAKADRDRRRELVFLFWGLTYTSGRQQLAATCGDKQSQTEFRVYTDHMLSPLTLAEAASPASLVYL